MLAAKRKKHNMKRTKKTIMDYLISFGLVIIMITISMPRTVLAQVIPDFNDISQTIAGIPNAKVKLPNTEYTESTIDLRVKVLGGEVKINRTWDNGRWYVNPAWANLRFIQDPLDNSVNSIDRSGIFYKRTGDANLYKFEQVYIKKTDTGWQWYDRQGNWINYDAAGRITEYGDSNKVKVTFLLDAEGRRTAIHDHHGELVYNFKYDANEHLIQIQDREGRTVSYYWQGDRLITVTDVLGYNWQYGYDAKGQLNQRVEPDSGIIKIEYSESIEAPKTAMTSGKNTSTSTYSQRNMVSNGLVIVSSTNKSKKDTKVARISKITDRTGAITIYNTQYNRNTKQYSITVIDPQGIKTVRDFNAKGKQLSTTVNDVVTETFKRDGDYLLKITNQRGLTKTIAYNQAKQPIKVTYPDGSSEQFEYDNTLGVKTRYINAQGIITNWQYDIRGNLVKKIKALGKPEQKVTSWIRNIYGQPISTTKGEDNKAVTLQRSFDNYGNVITFIDGNNNNYSYTYNTQGQLTSKTNSLNNVWQINYNLAGQPVQTIDPLSSTTKYSIDFMGRITETTNPLGYKTSYNYSFDSTGWKISQTNALNQTTTYYYDTSARLTKAVSPSGLEFEQVYDNNGRIKQQTDQAGNITSMEYGATSSGLDGLVVKALYPTYNETYKYNTRGRPAQITQNIEHDISLTTHISYNELGKISTITKPNGSASTFEYDALGYVTKLMDALGGKTKQTWDIFGNLTQAIDAKENIYNFEYDKNSNLIKETRALGNTVENTYDALNQLIQQKDTAGNIISYQNDNAGRKIQETYTPKGQTTPSQTVTYTYNSADQLIDILQTGDTNTHFIYILDALGRTIKETITYGSGTKKITSTLKYSYDAEGNLASITYPDNSTVSYSYEKGQLTKTLLANGKEIIWNNYKWNSPTEISFPNAVQTYQYDGLMRPIDIKVNSNNNLLMDRQYGYDKVNNITQIKTEEGNKDYQYDLLDNLILATPSQTLQQKGLPVESYVYDEIGNRIGSSHQPGDWIYNSNNQLIQWGKDQEQTTLTYTANGHLGSETTTTKALNYTYNAADRLITIKSPDSEIANYQYDPFGRRISKTINGTTIYFIYSDKGLLAELNEQGSVKIAYDWKPDSSWGTEPLWQANIETGNNLTTAQYHYLYNDHLGTPQLAANSTGLQTWKAESEAFGKISIDPNNLIAMNLRFPGQYYDQETGLYYNYFRDYNPNTGRYTQSDPIGLKGGLNPFIYTNGNPLKWIDPEGRAIPLAIPIGAGLILLYTYVTTTETIIVDGNTNYFPGTDCFPGRTVTTPPLAIPFLAYIYMTKAIWISPVDDRSGPTWISAVDDKPRNNNEDEGRCKKVKAFCISKCTALLPTRTNSGDPYFLCKRECMDSFGCP